MMKELTAAIKNNRPALVIGKAGTAKTAMVHKIAAEFGYPVETLLLAGILPEDLGGLVRPDNAKDPKSFKYIPPQWAVKYGNEPFVLFLDEVNQASIQTLHAMFYLVNDRTVAGIALPNMRIVAAGNGEDENEFLTPMPAPLLDRFVYRIKWKCDLQTSLHYLRDKYKHIKYAADLLLDAVAATFTESTTPRHVEQMLMLIEDGTDTSERGRELVGAAYDVYIEKATATKRHEQDDRFSYLSDIVERIRSNCVVAVGNTLIKLTPEELMADLTDEEKEMVRNAL